MARKYNKVGRPPRHIKAQRDLAINLSWETVLKYLQNPKSDMKHKVEIAKAICVKAMPTHIEGEIVEEKRLIIIRYSDENKPQEVAGQVRI